MQKQLYAVEAGPCTSNDLDSPTSERNEHTFLTLRTAFALKGQTLQRTTPADGPVSYWAERWGLVRHLPDTDAACRFLEQIGGRV